MSDWYGPVSERDESGHTKLEVLLAKALYKHGELISTLYLNLGKKNLHIFHEMQDSLRAIPTEAGPWINEIGSGVA